MNKSSSNKTKVKVNLISNYKKLSKEEENWLMINTTPPQPPLTIEKLNLKMNEIYGFKERKRDIKFYLKTKLNFSYKKGSSKPPPFVNTGNKLFQVIYSSKMLKNINSDKILVNIDEASFNRSLKNNYSWMPKGITSSII